MDYDDLPSFDYDLENAHPGVKYWYAGNEDCIDGMRRFPDGCIKAIVSDPPYGISIDSKNWDKDVPGVPVWREALRLLQPR